MWQKAAQRIPDPPRLSWAADQPWVAEPTEWGPRHRRRTTVGGLLKITRHRILILVVIADILLVALLWRVTHPARGRVDDRVGLIPAYDEQQYGRYLDQVQSESGIDIRIALVPDTRGRPPEQYALALMRDLGVGRETGGRGLLILYDTLARSMRIEVGPKLEGILPDAFVGYLMREHVDAFFGAGRPELGLRTTLFMIHWRIRMARLGEEYDPSFEEYVRDVRRLGAGGGASGRIALDSGLARLINRTGDTAASGYFRPQPSVEAAYLRHQEWLALGGGQMDVPLFTPASRTFLQQRLPLSPAFNAYLLAGEYGRRYQVDRRGDLAMVFYTDDPFLSPKFFRRTPEGWQMDVVAEVANSQETVGFWWTWRLRVSGDDFSRVFADRYTPMNVPGVPDYYRVAGGDNRALTIRGTADPVASELDPGADPVVMPSLDALPGVEWLTVRQAAERIQGARGQPSIVLLYGTWNEQTRGQFPEIVRLARFCRERGMEFLAFQKDASYRAIADFPGFPRRHDAPFPALQLYPWRSGLLDATMGELGIRVGTRWSPPLVAVLDRDGRVVWQAQGVTDWEAVAATAAGLVPD